MSPRKVRLVADTIKGKLVTDAAQILSFGLRRPNEPLRKLLNSAVANAKHNFNIERDALFVKNITVDKGPTLKRSRARARGRAFPINKRSSHITLILTNKLKTKN